MKLRWCLLATLVACKAQGPNYCDDSNACLDDHLYCDLGAVFQPLRNQCIDLRQVNYACPDAGRCPDPLSICSMGKCVGCVQRSDCLVADRPVCEASGVCGPCGGDGDCAGARCRGDGACVQCLSSTDCSGATPACNTPVGICRTCRQDSECSSGVCKGDGSCASEAESIYVDAAVAASGPSCDRGAPCKTIAQGLAKVAGGRSVVHVAPGSYAEALTPGGTVSIVGRGADLAPSTFGQSGVTVTGTADVQVVGLNIHDFTIQTTVGGHGVVCTGGTPATTKVTLTQVTVDRNQAEGISATSCDVILQGSTVLRNQLGGVDLLNSDFDLANDYVTDNGSTGAIFGGIYIHGTAATTGRLEYVTVTENTAVNNPATASGVFCMVSTATLTLKNSIVYANLSAPNDSIGCSWTFSDIGGAGVASGNGNINALPMFLNIGGRNYHIGSTSSLVVNAAEPLSPVNIDFDGEPRPMRGTRNDMGADEVP